ncbi:MAG: metal-binding protein [Gemmatimonadetes bacterium]|nr:metal-binding protein [Gemmatimonadota bacterium]
MSSDKLYRLVSADGTNVSSTTPGTLGGHRKNRTYGRLDCKAARRALGTGRSYEQQRVFFADEATAIAAGYRPCAVCMPAQYAQWKAAGGKAR